jgi:hypothetical protein
MLSKAGSAHSSRSDRHVSLTVLMMDRIASPGAPGFRRVPNQPGTIVQTQGQHRPWRPPHRSRLKQNSPLWRTCGRGGKRQARYHGRKKLAGTCSSMNASSVRVQERHTSWATALRPSPSESRLCFLCRPLGVKRARSGFSAFSCFNASAVSGARNKDACITCIF